MGSERRLSVASDRRRWLRDLALEQAGRSVDDVVETVARHVAGLAAIPGADPVSEPPEGWTDPWLIGAVHEALASSEDRGRRGAFYTPRSVVEQVVDQVLPPDGPLPRFVVDPTCGGGAFLLVVLDRLVEGGCTPDEALERIGGMDIDRGAADAARWAVRAWGSGAGADPDAVSVAVGRIVVGDQLVGWPPAWPDVEMVVGNPPFATPLRGRGFPPAARTARDERRDRLGPYADLAALHLVVAVERCGPGARIALVLPQSLLAGRDAAAMRDWVERVAPLQALWASRDALFDAGVRVWAPVLVVGAQPRDDGGGWAPEAAAALGAPRVRLSASGETLGSIVSATAGFRDEYYALAAACVEADEDPEASRGRLRLATVGSLDPLVSWWGRKPTRFAKRHWDRPVIDPRRIPEARQAWFERQGRPKVLLPTQSRILEPFVDRDGVFAPATPLLSLGADAADLDLVVAVLLAPAVSAWCHAQWFGTAMSVDAIKVAARDLASIPLPPDRTAWSEAAALVATADGCEPDEAHRIAVEVASLMNEAYHTDPAVGSWWNDRAAALVP